MIARILCWLFGHRPTGRLHVTARMVIKTSRCDRCGVLLEADGDGRVGRAARRRAMRTLRRRTA